MKQGDISNLTSNTLMSRNATASWSGYNHQGKVGLLVALRKINSLFGTNPDLAEYVMEDGVQEGVKIQHLNTVIEVHQVKALTDATTIGSYTEALTNFEECPHLNYLHSICEIHNWANLTAAQNPKSVNRYPYTNVLNYCPLDDIFHYLDAEIFSFLNNAEHPQSTNAGWRENCFQEFLATLDEKIRFEHANNAQVDYNISFTLEEIAEIMTNAPAKSKSKLWEIRKKIYNQYIRFIQDLEINEIGPITPAHEYKIKEIIGQIYGLPDQQFVRFLCNINPHSSGKEKFESCVTTDNFFSEDTFYGTFLQTLISITATDYLLDPNAVPSYFKTVSYLVTSIQSIENNKKFHAMEILDNPVVNFAGYENDYIINQNYNGSLRDAAQRLIPTNPTRFLSKKDMKFISVNGAVLILNN